MTISSSLSGVGQKRGHELLIFGLIGALWLLWYIAKFDNFLNISAEEAADGTLTRGLLEGLAAPVWYYQYQPWAHGPLVEGFLLYPFFALGGSSLLWIKILALLFAAAGFATWTYIARRAWGFSPALLFALWWLLAPPFLADSLHFGWANHMESLFLGGVIVLAFIRAEKNPPGWRGAALTAAWAGVASFFCMQNLVFSLAAALALVWRWGRKGFLRVLWPGLPLFGLGFLPHWLYGQALHRHEQFIQLGSLSTVWGRWRDLFKIALPRVISPLDPSVSVLTLLVVLGAAVAGGVWWLRPANDPGQKKNNDRWLGRILLLYGLLYLLSFGFSRFYLADPTSPYNLRYLIPLAVVFLAIASRILAHAPYRLGWLLAIPLLFLFNLADMNVRAGAANFGKRLREGVFAAELYALRGDDYHFLVDEDLVKYWQTRTSGESPSWNAKWDAAQDSIQRLPAPWKIRGYQLLGEWLGAKDAMQAVRLHRELTTIWKRAAAFGAGRDGLRRAVTGSEDRRFTAAGLLTLVGEWEMIDANTAEAFVAGLGYGLMEWFTCDRQLLIYFQMPAPLSLPEKRPDRYNEFQWSTLLAALALKDQLVGSLKPEQQRALAFGVGEYQAASDDSSYLLSHLGLPADPEMELTYRQGWAAGDAWLYLRFYRRIPCSSAATTFVAIQYPELARPALREMGVELRPLPDRPDLCELKYGL